MKTKVLPKLVVLLGIASFACSSIPFLSKPTETSIPAPVEPTATAEGSFGPG